MNLALSEHLPLIASAPDGIRKLRKLILELAVRGKLVPQCSEDEPAYNLVARIHKDRLIRQSEVGGRKSKSLPPITENSAPFTLPNNWAWVRNGELFALRKGKVPKDLSESVGSIPYLDIEALDRGNVRRYTNDCNVPTSTTTDMLVVCDGSRSGLLLNGADGAIGSTLAIIETPQYIQPLIRLIFKEAYERLNTTMKGAAIPHLDTAKLLLEVVGVPPMAEQQRILSKVDELMALCDRLESEQNDSATAHEQLVEILLGTLTQSTDAADFEANWKRVAEHFDMLFATESSIDSLQSTVLQLAIMGKLVKQDSNDESAHELLKKVAQERTKLAKRNSSKVSKSPKPVPENEQQFSIPNSWKWERLEAIAVTSTGKTPPTSKADLYGGALPFIGPGQITIMGEILPSEKMLSDAGKNETTLADTGDILMVCIGGSIGKAAIANKQTAFNQQINCAKPILVDSRYLYAGLTSQYFQTVLLTKATGSATPIINKSNWAEIPIPVPPITEQQRIVEKIDELMGLCKRLKAQLIELNESNGLLSSVLIQGQLS